MPKSEPSKYESGGVTMQSKALDLKSSIFTWKDHKRLGHSLKKFAESGSRRTSSPSQPAVSMLTFYEKRAAERLPTGHRKILEDAKEKFRALFSGESSDEPGSLSSETPPALSGR